MADFSGKGSRRRFAERLLAEAELRASVSGGVTGRGTANALPRWTSAATLGDSIITQSGTTATVTGTLAVTTRVTSPLIGTTTATDLVLDRNSVTQLTLGSLLATFAGAVTVPTIFTLGSGGAIADTTSSVLLKNASGGVDFAAGPFRISRAVNTPTVSLRFAGVLGTVAVPVAPAGTAELGQIAFQGWDASAYYDGARFYAESNGSWSGSDRGTNVRIENILDGTTALRTAFEVGGDGSLHAYTDPNTYMVLAGSTLDMARFADDAIGTGFSADAFRGTRSVPAVCQSGDLLGYYQFAGYNAGAGDGIYVGSDIRSATTALWSSTEGGTNMTFRVTPAGSVTKSVVLTLTSTTAAFGSVVLTAGTYNGQTISATASLTGSLQTTTGIGIATAPLAYVSLVASMAMSGSGTQRVIQASGVFGTDATSTAQSIRSVPTFASGAYTTVTAAHFYGGTMAVGGGGHAITTAHGLYLEDVTAGGTNYSIYTNAGLVRFGGVVNTTGSYQVDGTQVVGNQGAAVTDPTGGMVIDAEARTAIIAIIDRLQAHGLIA